VTTSERLENSLRAGHIHQRILVARDHPDSERVRRHLHDALTGHLVAALATALDAAGTPTDDAVWQIRELRVELSVNADWNAELLAREWAERLTRAVLRAIKMGGDGVTVVRFPTRAAFLAAFIRDAADGVAFSRWWFDAFEGLALLTRSAQIRTAISRDAQLGAAALAQLSRSEASLVVGQLSASDAGVVLDAIAPERSDEDAARVAVVLLEAYRTLGAPSLHASEERSALTLVVEALRGGHETLTGPFASIARAMARLSKLNGSGEARRAVIRRLLGEGNAPALRLILDDGDAERLAPLAGIGRAAAEAVVDELMPADRPTATRARDAAAEVEWVPFGAPLLFAPLLASLPIEQATRGWPGIGDPSTPANRRATPAALVRLLLAATMCGGERAARIVVEPFMKTLMGVGEAVSITSVRDWLERLRVWHAARLEWTVAEWRASVGSIALHSWLMADVGGGEEAPSRLVLVDCARGHWIARRDADGALITGAVRGMQHPLRGLAGGAPREIIASDDRVARVLESVVDPKTRVRRVEEIDAPTDQPVGATLARLDRIAGEIDWLALPQALGVPRAMELALASVAQGVLRDLAWRLPGFARASLPHLWTNFLSIDAHLAWEETRVVAHVARPTLGMVMAMTGMLRQSYRLPWLDSLEIALFPAERR
jgi:hypothetical protein